MQSWKLYILPAICQILHCCILWLSLLDSTFALFLFCLYFFIQNILFLMFFVLLLYKKINIDQILEMALRASFTCEYFMTKNSFIVQVPMLLFVPIVNKNICIMYVYVCCKKWIASKEHTFDVCHLCPFIFYFLKGSLMCHYKFLGDMPVVQYFCNNVGLYPLISRTMSPHRELNVYFIVCAHFPCFFFSE